MISHLLQHPVGLVHVLAALGALAAGTGVVAMRKGTRRHKRWGRAYLWLMVLMNATALLDYELFGGFGPFHWAALASLATLLGGWWAVRHRAPYWALRHGYFMAGSYVGLLAAAAAEVATRVPGWSFGPAVAWSSAVVIALGLAVMARGVPRAVHRMAGRTGG